MTLYIITYDYRGPRGRTTGTYDMSLNDHSRKEVARVIADSLVPGVEKIYECSTDHPMRDITEDIARDVRDLVMAEDTQEWDYEIVNWLHDVLGTSSIPWPVAAE